MYNVGGSIIGLHDPNTQTIRFNAVFIGRQNVAQGFKNPDVDRWGLSIKLYYADGNGTITLDTVGLTSPYASLDGNGVFTYKKDKFESSTYAGTSIKPYYTSISVNCRAYSPDSDDYENLTFVFRYGQIAT